MTYVEAILAMSKGKEVKRESWITPIHMEGVVLKDAGLTEKEVSSLMKLIQYAVYKDMKVLDLNYQINKLREKENEND